MPAGSGISNANAKLVLLADGCVDELIAQTILTHVLEPHVAVEEILRVLNPAALSTPRQRLPEMQTDVGGRGRQ